MRSISAPRTANLASESHDSVLNSTLHPGNENLEQALKHSEAQRRAVLDSALDSIICTDARGVVTDFNSAAERTFRIAHSEACGKDLVDIIFPIDLQEEHRRELFGKSASGEIDVLGTRMETRALRATGAEFPAEVTVTGFTIAGETSFNVSIRDVSARRKAEETVVRLAAIVESSQDAIIGFDFEGCITNWNRGAERMSGYSEPEAVGKSMLFLMPDHRVADYTRCVTVLKARHSLENFETVWVGKDGVRFDVSLTTSSILNADGEMVGGSIIARDITARKIAEEALRKANETSIYASPIPIVAADASGNVTMWNGAAEKTFGWSENEVKGRPNPIIPNEDLDAAAQLHARMLAGEILRGIEVRRKKRDGTSVDISLSGTPLWDEAGNVRGMIGFLTDITRHHELEEQLRQMQKIEAIGRLAGGVAHDFNNVLMAISSYAELLSRKLPEGDATRRYVDEIVRATDRGSSLTQGLLAFSRKQVLSPQIVDLNALVADQINMLERLVGESIVIRFQAGVDIGPTRVDPGQVQQVVMNLVINARDAMPNGGEVLIETANAELEHVRSESGSPPCTDYVTLSVSDTGCGIDAETKAHIFEPFFTTKGPGKGTGLGLATVFGIVKQSNGQILLESQPGVGTTFKVCFPRVEGGQTLAAADRQLIPIAGHETILLVEDQGAIRESAAEYLAGNGYTVLKACNGAEALDLLSQHEGAIDLLVTDVVMPQMSGKDLADRFCVVHRNAKVIFMSGYANNILSGQALDRNRVLLQKPFRLALLGQRVREALDDSIGGSPNFAIEDARATSAGADAC